MRRTLTALVALAVVVSMVAAAPMAAAGQAYALQDDEEESDDEEIEPGEQFAGVVAVHESEFEGELSERTFGVKIAQSASADAQGEVVADQLDDVEQRIDELEDRAEELEQKRDDGEITEGQYRAEMAVVASERQTAVNLAEQSEASSEGLPADVLEANGIDVDAIATLQDRASELGGPDVAAAAQSIAGANASSDRGNTEIGVGADGELTVDIPGLSDSNGDESDDEGEESGASAEADSETEADAGTDDGDASADSETDVDADADDDGVSVEGESETDVSAES